MLLLGCSQPRRTSTAVSMDKLEFYSPLAVPLHDDSEGSLRPLTSICEYHQAEIVPAFCRQFADFQQRTGVCFAAHKAKIGVASVLQASSDSKSETRDARRECLPFGYKADARLDHCLERDE